MSKAGENVEEVETADLLIRDRRNKFLLQGSEKVLVKCRLVNTDLCGLKSEPEVK